MSCMFERVHSWRNCESDAMQTFVPFIMYLAMVRTSKYHYNVSLVSNINTCINSTPVFSLKYTESESYSLLSDALIYSNCFTLLLAAPVSLLASNTCEAMKQQ